MMTLFSMPKNAKKSVTQGVSNTAPVLLSGLALVVGAASVQNAHASKSQDLQPFTAEYSFKINKKYSGTATRTLKKTQAGLWQYDFSASIPIVAKAHQHTLFEYKKGVVFPFVHTNSFKVLVKKNTTKLDFNYPKKQLKITEKGKSSTQALLPNTLDELALDIQIRQDLKRGKLKPFYRTVNKTKVLKAPFKNLGKTSIKVPAGTFEVIKLQRVHKSPKRKSFFWLAPKLDYLPVRVYTDDKGKIYDFKLSKKPQ